MLLLRPDVIILSDELSLNTCFIVVQVDVLIFIETEVMVRDEWLGPLLLTLDKYPHAGMLPFLV